MSRQPTDTEITLGFYANNVFLPLHMKGTNFLADSFYPSTDKLQQFPCFSISDKAIWYPTNLRYPGILAMSQTMEEEDAPVGSRSTQTFYISNEYIETGMKMSNIHAKIVKSVNINQ